MTWLKPRDKPKSQFIQKTFCHISYLSLVVKRSRSRSLGIYGVFSLLIKDLILYKIKIQFDKSHELSIVFPRLKLYVDCFDISYFIMNSIDKSMNDFDMYQHMHRYSDMKKRFIIQLVSQLVFSYPLRRGYYDVLPRTRKNSCHIKNNWTRYLSTIYCNQYNFSKYIYIQHHDVPMSITILQSRSRTSRLA